MKIRTIGSSLVKKTIQEIRSQTAHHYMLEHEHDLVPIKPNGEENLAENHRVRCILCDACYCQLCGKILSNNNLIKR